MAQPFGNSASGPYGFGLITVTTPGTPVALNVNVPATTGFGTPTTGVSPYTSTGTPANMVCNTLMLTTSPGNTGLTYLCFLGKGAGALKGGTGRPASIIVALPPGVFFPLEMGVGSNPLMPALYGVDADSVNNSMWVSALVL